MKIGLFKALQDAGIRSIQEYCLSDKCIFRTRRPEMVFADLLAFSPDGESSVFIEIKDSNGTHSITQAVGQCLLYRQFHPESAVAIVVPNSLRVADIAQKLCEDLDIMLWSDSRAVDEIRSLFGMPTTDEAMPSEEFLPRKTMRVLSTLAFLFPETQSALAK